MPIPAPGLQARLRTAPLPPPWWRAFHPAATATKVPELASDKQVTGYRFIARGTSTIYWQQRETTAPLSLGENQMNKQTIN